MEISKSKNILKSKNIVHNPLIVLREESDDWAILFNPETAKAVGINPIGIVIWKLINGRRRIEDIVTEINQHVSDIPNTAVDEISSFVDELYKNGFIGYSIDN